MKAGRFLGMALGIVGGLQAQTPSLNISPDTQRIERDSIAVMRIRVSSLPACHAYEVQVTYDAQIARCRSVRELQFFPVQTFFSALNDSINGRITIDEALLGPGGQNGTGDLAELKFVGLRDGSTTMSFSNADFRDGANQTIAVTTSGGTIQVGRSTVVKEREHTVPDVTVVGSCYPNPFNPSTTIRYNRAGAGYAKVQVYTLNGREVLSQFEEHQDQGEHRFVWHGRDHGGRRLASGVYFVFIETARSTAMTRVLLVR
ncbi:MAG: T9SS type A sorting domain-containing protein [Bacteroidota bacterium]